MPKFTAIEFHQSWATNLYIGCRILVFDLAIQELDEAIRLDPQNAIAYFWRGVAYEDLGQRRQAIQDFDEAIRLDPQYGNAYSRRRSSYDGIGQYERAIQDHDEAIRLDPQNAIAYTLRGATHASQFFGVSKYKQAIRDFDDAIRLFSEQHSPEYPLLAKIYNWRGWVYDILKEYQLAIDDYNKAIRLDPQYANAYYNRGKSLQKRGEYYDVSRSEYRIMAERDFQKAKELGYEPQSD